MVPGVTAANLRYPVVPMYCSACGSPNAAEARFCSACGAVLAATVTPATVSLQPSPVAVFNVAPIPYGLRATFLCPHCRQATAPIPFFSRGFNLVKMLILGAAVFPLSALYFFWRKDRFLCTWCRRVLPNGAPVGLLGAFSRDTPYQPAPGTPGVLAPASGPGSHEHALLAAQESHDIVRLDKASRRNRARTFTFGVVTVGMLGSGVAALVGSSTEAAAFFLGMGGLGSVVTVFAETRSRRLRDEANEKRQRQRGFEIVALARQHGGRLSVTQVAGQLRIDFKEAEAALDALADGHRVDIESDDEGRVSYVFRELL